jgi:hypothetical protein
MNDSLTDLIASEAAKRDRNWDPAERCRVIQDTITWAEIRGNIRRNTKAACLADQERKLKMFAELQTRSDLPASMASVASRP